MDGQDEVLTLLHLPKGPQALLEEVLQAVESRRPGRPAQQSYEIQNQAVPNQFDQFQPELADQFDLLLPVPFPAS
jgi:hypothetical protein